MLTWRKIHKRFGENTVANGIDLQVEQGELVALLGHSGSGKSTLLKIAAGLIAPDSGSVFFNGENYTFRQPEHRRFALMFQDYALFPHLNAWQNVAFGLRMRGVSRRQAKIESFAMLEKVGLPHHAEQRIDSLSGGEQQRVALARALIIRPQALLLDEAFSALDHDLRIQLQQLTLALLREQNCPAVWVTHSPEEALFLADQAYLLHQGQWVQHGSAAELLAHPKSAWTARLLGCDNVSSTHYIPQHAIYLNHPQGMLSLLCSRQILPNANRLHWQHPQHGDIIQWQYSDYSETLSIGTHYPLWTDRNQWIFFSDNTP
ncbi:ABC transporter ATP-binding protein [Stenoxybacter acetivorans]|uniref:ABC transporter ATP-binding protein n=1 Tax=Stenoxybacter acetivorans TaxID=422441 RepID=UPI00055A05AB|nr:ABC transporter ATP-binding protein [Stenoxybacter acetivorans]